ncbi:MAG: hypothetical protein WKG00_26705 [Polyangiaceae bacterium]
MHGKHGEAGFPAEVTFHGMLFNPAANAVLVRVCDRTLEHPGMRVYHRNVTEEVYRPTFQLRNDESVDSLVVPLGVPFAFGLVRTWIDSPLGWSGGQRRVTRAPLDGASKARTLEWRGPQSSKLIELLGVTDDGASIHCKASVPVELAGNERAVQHRLYQWSVASGEVMEVARLARAFF